MSTYHLKTILTALCKSLHNDEHKVERITEGRPTKSMHKCRWAEGGNKESGEEREAEASKQVYSFSLQLNGHLKMFPESL